jgi:lipopolysaccharide export system protein LptA
MRAIKDGHKIVARDLHLVGPNRSGVGQQARARGPGQIDLFDRGNPQKQYPTHAIWNDLMTSVKDKEGDQLFDLLTFTGSALFIDDERDQRLQGERLQVWLQPNQAAADTPTPPQGTVQANNAPKQKLHRVLAQDKVRAITADMLIRHTNRLTITFLPEVAAGDRLPDVAAVTTVQKPAAPNPASPRPSEPAAPGEIKGPAPTPGVAVIPVEEKKEKKKEDKPIELTADEVVMYVTTLGTKKELQEMKAEGSVYVVQDGDVPGEKKVEIRGQLLNLMHHVQGDTLFVYSEPGKWADLELGKLKMQGPKIVINQKDNIAEVEGQGAMTLPPSEKNFDGTLPAKTMVGQPESRLTIHWAKNMIFRGKDADFYGGVQAYQDGSKLLCQDLSVTFDRFISLKEGQKGGQGAKVDQLLCNLKVFAVDQKLEEGKFLQGTVIEGTQLESFNPEGKTNVSGPGRVRHLAFGNSDINQTTKPADQKDPKANDVLKLTTIHFRDRMHSLNNPASKTAKFYGNIHVFHFPSESWDATMDPDRPPKNGFYMHCDRLTVATRPEGNRTQQLMVAEQKVFFRTDEFYGYCDVLKFDEAQDNIIFEAVEGNLVRLFKRLTPGSTGDEVTGKKVLYNRRTGRFNVNDSTNFRSQ